MTIAPLTPGRIFLTLVACTLGPGCFLADWSASHVVNPRWPPHAKFHNGQTMAMGAGLSLATLYYTWRGYGHGRGRGRDDRPALQDATAAAARPDLGPEVEIELELQKESIKTATLFGSLYWVTAIAAWFFPGALAVDPEFGTGFPQFPLFSGMLGLAWGDSDSDSQRELILYLLWAGFDHTTDSPTCLRRRSPQATQPGLGQTLRSVFGRLWYGDPERSVREEKKEQQQRWSRAEQDSFTR